MKKDVISNKWKKIDKLTAIETDGTKVWIDIRGLIGLEKPNGYNISLGASFANGSEPHDRKFRPPTNNEIIHVYDEKVLFWSKNGYSTGKRIPQNIKQVLLDNIKLGMKSLGYNIKYIKI